MNRYDVDHWKCLGYTNRVRLGTWLLDCIIEVHTGWFTKELRKGR